MKYRLKYLCVCQFDKENRGDVFTRTVLEVTGSSPHLQLLTEPMGDRALVQLQAGSLTVCESVIFSHGPAGYVHFEFVFLIWKMCLLRVELTNWRT